MAPGSSWTFMSNSRDQRGGCPDGASYGPNHIQSWRLTGTWGLRAQHGFLPWSWRAHTTDPCRSAFIPGAVNRGGQLTAPMEPFAVSILVPSAVALAATPGRASVEAGSRAEADV